ncbi:MAG: ABC transporter permease subunit [Bacillota bacterium]|nr:ABC transporter permease subunit [Bacillota bacterium]
MKKTLKLRLWPVLFWLLLWHGASLLLNRDSLLILLPSPILVLQHLGELALTAAFWSSIAFSLLRIAGGFFLAVLLGILLAALSAGFRWVQELLAPLMLSMKTIPVASFIILALILFSSRNLAALISFLMVLPIIYTNVLAGIRSADRQLLEMGRLFRLPAPRMIRYLYIPQVMPFFRSGCAISLGLCWKSGIAAEVIGVSGGSIGEQLQQAKLYVDTPDLFAWTLVIVLLSLAFEKLVLFLLAKAAGQLEKI